MSFMAFLSLKSMNSVWLQTKFVFEESYSVLIGGAFERGEGIWTSQSLKVQMPGGLPGGSMLKLQFDWYIITLFQAKMSLKEHIL